MSTENKRTGPAPAVLTTPARPPVGPGWRGRASQYGLTGVGTSLLRLRELSVLVVIIAFLIYFGFSKSELFSTNNLGNIVDFSAAAAIIAAGEVMLLVCGEIDLSAGMTYAMIPLMMWSMQNNGVPIVGALIIALVIAVAFGIFNGLVTVLLGLPSFITTLGSNFLMHGITLTVSSSFPKSAPSSGTFFQIFGGWQWSEFGWAAAIAIVMQIVLTNTRWGAYTIATGANPLGAAEAGVKTRVIKVRAFVVTAVLAGLAGIIDQTHITGSFDPNGGGNDLMFKAVAAAVIGGTALLGGSGTVIGAFLGAFLLGVMSNGFALQSISANTFFIIEGVAIIIAMVLNTQLTRVRREPKAY